MEPAPLSGMVAAVVAAFENGEALVKKIREDRAQVGAPLPPPALEQSLLKGPRAVREAFETGWETYGDSFQVENDRTALDAFKDILISLQGTLFQQLFTAQGDNLMNDFGVVLSASNMGRVRSVHVLNEMYMKMAEAAPIQDQLSRQAPQLQHTPDVQQSQTMPGSDSPFTSPAAGFTWNGHKTRIRTDFPNSTVDTFEAPRAAPRSAGSRFPLSFTSGVTSNTSSHSHTSSGTTNITHDSDEAALAGSPPVTKKTFRSALASPPFEGDILEDNHREHTANFPRPNSVSSDCKSLHASSSCASNVSGTSPEIISYSKTMSPFNTNNINNVGNHVPFHVPTSTISSNSKKSYDSSSGISIGSGVSPQINSHSTTSSPYKTKSVDSNGNKIPFHIAPLPEYRKRLNNKPKAKRAATQGPPTTSSRPSPTTSKSSSRKLSLFGGSKAPREDCAGFCKGAHCMQVGENGMKIRNQSVSFTGQNNYWTCSNSMCCFEGHAVPKKDEKKKTSFGFDEDVREAYGVKYRWSFLAKSHTMIGNSKSGYEFQCVFCVGQGAPCFRIKGEKQFIQHVVTHQGQTPNELKMPSVKYVIGREASDWEQFDVNLPAPTAILLETLEQPTELEAPEPRLPEMEASLAIPGRVTRPMTVHSGNANETDHSGLGIRMSTGTILEIVQDYGTDRRPSMHSPGIARSAEAANGVEWRDDAGDHPLVHGTSQHNEVDYEEKEMNSGSALEHDWTTTRDTMHSLHPAPLFAWNPSPRPADYERGRDYQQQHQQQQHLYHHHHHHQGYHQPPKPSPGVPQRRADDYMDTYAYDDTADIVDPELRGSISVPNS